MSSGIDGDLELGADAIGGGHQDGIGIPGLTKVEESAESPEAGGGAGTGRGFGKRFDGFDQGIAGVDVDAGIPVGQAIGVLCVANGILAGMAVPRCRSKGRRIMA
jgi:hypothetical protein